MTQLSIDVRPPLEDEYEQWAVLFRAYRQFYRLAPDETVVERVWSWVHDPAHETRALVAALPGSRVRPGVPGSIVGLAHYRCFARPSTGTRGVFLDDLLTDPGHRGQGIGRALITGVGEAAVQDGCSLLRWITADDNEPGQHLYDQVATKTTWLTYDRHLV